MSEIYKIKPVVVIPSHLVGQVQAKMGYVDEAIGEAFILEDGSEIQLTLRYALESPSVLPTALHGISRAWLGPVISIAAVAVTISGFVV